MPHTFAEIVDHGTTFTNYYDATPLCCPARAGVLTGQYGHNNGVLSNKPGYGDLAGNENMLPVWLQRAGYKTAIVGKYLNGYENAVDDKDDVAPGLGPVVGRDRQRARLLRLQARGERQAAQGDLQGRVPDRRHQPARRGGHPPPLRRPDPFFLWVTQSAPHVENINANSGGPCGGEAVPPPRDLGRFAGDAAAPTPGRARAGRLRQARDRQRPAARSAPPQRRVIRHRYECRIETLPAVDRGVARIVDALRQTGELDDTILVFTSDNGTFQGQHRLPGGKGLAYEEAAHLPLADPGAAEVHAGGRAPPATSATMTANIDYAPTFVDWAGPQTCPEVGDCRVMDGRSWLPLFDPKRGRVPGRPPDRDRARPEQGLGRSPGAGSRARIEGVRNEPLPVRPPHVAARPRDRAVRADRRARALRPRDGPVRAAEPAAGAAGLADEALESRLSTLTDELHVCAGIEGRDPSRRAVSTAASPAASRSPVLDLVAVESVALGVRPVEALDDEERDRVALDEPHDLGAVVSSSAATSSTVSSRGSSGHSASRGLTGARSP